MNPDGVYAFIELRSAHMADIALQLNGQMLHGRPMKVGRPSVPPAAQPLKPQAAVSGPFPLKPSVAPPTHQLHDEPPPGFEHSRSAHAAASADEWTVAAIKQARQAVAAAQYTQNPAPAERSSGGEERRVGSEVEDEWATAGRKNKGKVAPKKQPTAERWGTAQAAVGAPHRQPYASGFDLLKSPEGKDDEADVSAPSSAPGPRVTSTRRLKVRHSFGQAAQLSICGRSRCRRKH